MAVNTNEVFLVAGQRVARDGEGVEQLSPVIESCVVVAKNAQDVQAALEKQQPDYRPVGITPLSEYENAVLRIRDALAGRNKEWPLIVAPSMQ